MFLGTACKTIRCTMDSTINLGLWRFRETQPCSSSSSPSSTLPPPHVTISQCFHKTSYHDSDDCLHLCFSSGSIAFQNGEGHPGRSQPPFYSQTALWWESIHYKIVSSANLDIALCHVSVCASAFQTEGKLYLILDFLRGGDLFTRLSKEVST